MTDLVNFKPFTIIALVKDQNSWAKEIKNPRKENAGEVLTEFPGTKVKSRLS